jgi:sugar/nucleoside kinase (ribokinase family)
VQFDVITIGTATQDTYLIGKSFRVVDDPHFSEKLGFVEHEGICFTLGGKIEVDDVITTTGGGATNAAVTFSRQGFRTACIAKIGDDLSGKAVEDELRSERITPFLKRDTSGRTAYSTILLTPEGERTILVYRGASEYLSGNDIPWQKLNSRWAYLASGGISFSLLQKLVGHLHRRGTKIAINPGKVQLAMGLAKLTPILRKIDVCILNREEAARLAKAPYGEARKVFDVLDRAVKGILVVTDGPRGSKVSDGTMRLAAGTFKERRVADRTGAGDSFGSGFVAGLMRRPGDYRYALRLASANATSNIESIGAKTGILRQAEFEKSARWRRLEINMLQ